MKIASTFFLPHYGFALRAMFGDSFQDRRNGQLLISSKFLSLSRGIAGRLEKMM